MPHSTPRRHVLLVGIDAYTSVDPLFGSVNDVDAIEEVLLDRLHVPAGAITKLAAPHSWQERRPRLPEREPTEANLRAALETLAGDSVQPGDRVLIYYAGHGTQLLPRDQGIVREALVPSDLQDGGALLYDHEINTILGRIARRTTDLTVVLDCCCSAGATRSALRPPDSAVRFCRIDAPQPLFRGSPGGDVAAGGLLPFIDSSDPGYLVVAACQAHESAREGKSALGRRHGALTAALLALLAAQPDAHLESLRWADIWHALQGQVSARYSDQHPWLIGRAERRVFGGPFRPQDLGYAMAHEGAYVRIASGTMVGLTRGARVAVYGPTPDFFPPVGLPEDLAVRIGELEVQAATTASCIAAPIGPPFALVQGARGRMIAAGEGDALVVQLDPYDAALARWLESRDRGLLRIVPAARAAGDDDRVEAFVGTIENGDRWLGDDLHGHDAAGSTGEPPLAWMPAGDAWALLGGLRHYAKYNLTLRLSRRCRDLPGALRVRVLDCRNLAGLPEADLQAARLPEVRPDPEGRYRYVLEHGQPIGIAVENRSSERLFANVLNCGASGRVEVLGTTQVELPPGRYQTFWRGGQIGDAFRCSVPKGRASGVDRLIVVASTVPGVDLSFLKEKRTFVEAIQAGTMDPGSGQPEPRELWTATLVTLKIA